MKPAPAVDKHGKTASEILFDHGIDMNWTDSWFFEQAVKAVEHALRQQPTVVDKPDFWKIAVEKWEDDNAELDAESWQEEILQYTSVFCEGAEYAWKQANHQQPTEWIPVSQEPYPNRKHNWFWVYMPSYSFPSQQVAVFNQSKRWMIDAKDVTNYVTAYRPLPEPPKP